MPWHISKYLPGEQKQQEQQLQQQLLYYYYYVLPTKITTGEAK